MLSKETLWLATEELMSDNNGKLSMLINTLSQRKVNLMNNLGYTLKEISMLFLNWEQTDTLT
jgi:hypothetical protein